MSKAIVSAPAAAASWLKRPVLAPRSQTVAGRTRVEKVAHEIQLLLGGLVGVVGLGVVVGPLGSVGNPVQRLNRGPQTIEQTQQRPPREPTRLSDHVCFLTIRLLCPGVPVEVDQQPGIEFGPPRQEPAGQVEREAVEVEPKQRHNPGVDVAHQGERREEVLAELAVGHPGLAFLVDLEGKRVDQDGLSRDELDVEGAGVLEREAGGDGPLLDVQGPERGGLELAKAPLVGIRDERDGIRLENPMTDRRVKCGLGDLAVGDQPAVGDQRLVETGLDPAVIDGLIRPVDLTEQDTLTVGTQTRWGRGTSRRPGVPGAEALRSRCPLPVRCSIKVRLPNSLTWIPRSEWSFRTDPRGKERTRLEPVATTVSARTGHRTPPPGAVARHNCRCRGQGSQRWSAG